jgi:hypothetical protein
MSIRAATRPVDEQLIDETDLAYKDLQTKKKPGPKEPGLRYWPREADTITFQEGLLNCRATGGGGHMRDATDQRSSTMILIGAARQPSEPHVSHAVSGPSIKTANSRAD